MTDGDIMVMMRNTALMLERIAKETGQNIIIDACPDSYCGVSMGGYAFYGLTTEYGRSEMYKYIPKRGAFKEVQPAQIRFGRPPKKTAPPLEGASGACKKQLATSVAQKGGECNGNII